MLDISQIKYTDSYENDDYDTITWYFEGPASLAQTNCPNVVGTDISIECPRKHREANYASVLISPVVRTPDGGMNSVYWRDWNISYEDVERILNLIPAVAN